MSNSNAYSGSPWNQQAVAAQKSLRVGYDSSWAPLAPGVGNFRNPKMCLHLWVQSRPHQPAVGLTEGD